MDKNERNEEKSKSKPKTSESQLKNSKLSKKNLGNGLNYDEDDETFSDKNDTLIKTMGTNVRNERIARGLTMESVAEQMELTSGFIGLIERGERGITAPNILKFATLFDIPCDDLFIDNSSETKLKLYEKDPLVMKRNKIITLIKDCNMLELDSIISHIVDIKKFRTLSVEQKTNEGPSTVNYAEQHKNNKKNNKNNK